MNQVTYDHIVKNLSKLEIDLEKGVILNRKTNQIKNGYLYFMVDYKNVLVHQVIAVAGGLKPVGLTINHKNGNKQDNRLENLEVVTRGDNVRHYVKNNKDVKIDYEKAQEIRQRYSTGEKGVDLAKEFGVTKSYISRIIKNKCWRSDDYEKI